MSVYGFNLKVQRKNGINCVDSVSRPIESIREVPALGVVQNGRRPQLEVLGILLWPISSIHMFSFAAEDKEEGPPIVSKGFRHVSSDVDGAFQDR